MAYIIYTPETRTDPADSNLVIEEDEVLEAVKDIYEHEGMIPSIITLVDDYTQEDIEIEVSDYLDLTTIALIEVKAVQL